MARNRKFRFLTRNPVICILCLVLVPGSLKIYMFMNSSVPRGYLEKVPYETIAKPSPHDKVTVYLPPDRLENAPRVETIVTTSPHKEARRPSENTTERIMVYPRGGTGESVDISEDFDLDIFNSFCQIDANVNVAAVLPIYSSVDKFRARSLLRESLGRLARKMNCRIFFIVGMSKNNTVNQMLKDEYRVEKDILIVSKIDTYRDLNNKAATMVKWVSKYCTNIPYVIHMIDDAYIDLQRWLERLQSVQLDDYILGTVTNTKTERRHWLYKSTVTVKEYPYPRFPIYAYGFAFAFPSRTAARLQSALYNATYCWIEDVWIAGHVRQTANLTIVPIKIGEYRQATGVKHMTPASVNPYMMYHPVSAENLKKIYLFQGGFD